MLNILKKILKINHFTNSKEYWENRYKNGGNSGKGSYGDYALFKAKVLNEFLNKHPEILSAIELGCGDGNQLDMIHYPHYLGFDISETIINYCRNKFKEDTNKEFKHISEFTNEKAELTLSLDVIYHLVEDDIYMNYMNQLFGSSTKYCIIFCTNHDQNDLKQAKHIKHRKITETISENFIEWQLIDMIENPKKNNTIFYADFFIYELK